MTRELNNINLVIVASDFNSRVVLKLLDGAQESCKLNKGIAENLKIYKKFQKMQIYKFGSVSFLIYMGFCINKHYIF